MTTWFDAALSFIAGAAGDPVDLGTLAQYGVVGLVAAGGIIFARTSYKRETDRSDRAEAEVARLNKVIIERNDMIVDRVIPALANAASAAEAANQMVRDMQRERERDLNRGSAGSPRRPRQEDRP